MKLLENAELERLSYTFAENAKDCRIDMRLEAYSCKMITSDKKEWKKSKQHGLNAPQPLSPPEELPWLPSGSPSTSQLPRLRSLSEPGCSDSNSDLDESGVVYADAISCRTLFELKSVMNAAFQDYDFSYTKSEAFSLIPNFEVLAGLVDSKLSATVLNYYEIKRTLWEKVEDIIKINECKLYSLKPGDLSTPLADKENSCYQTGYTGDPYCEDLVMWSFAYFLYNKNLKRILFMSCRAFRADPTQNLSAEQLWGVDV